MDRALEVLPEPVACRTFLLFQLFPLINACEFSHMPLKDPKGFRFFLRLLVVFIEKEKKWGNKSEAPSLPDLLL